LAGRGCVYALLAGNDVFVIQPTGGGKSLVFQIFPFLVNKKTLVISPTISLMMDQAHCLKQLNIPHLCINSELCRDTTLLNTALDQHSEARIVYVLPEYLYKNEVWTKALIDKFVGMAQQGELGLVVVDEAHLVEEWASFRPYPNVKKLSELMPRVPILALTATAVPETRESIIKMLRHPTILQSSMNRANVFLAAIAGPARPTSGIDTNRFQGK
jgi:ATP-dependent DNA helicase RecQ